MTSRRGEYRRWSETELQFLRDNRRKMTARQMADALGRTYQQTDGMNRYLLRVDGNRYTDGRTPCAWCGQIVKRRVRRGEARAYCNRTCANNFNNDRTCRERRDAAGVAHKRKWLPEDIQFLRDNYAAMTAAKMAIALGRGRIAVIHKLYKLGIAKPTFWTPEEDRFLSANRRRGYAWCAKQLGRSRHAVKRRARKIGAAIVNHWRNERHRETMLLRHGVASPGELRHLRAVQSRRAVVAVNLDKLGKALEAACPRS